MPGAPITERPPMWKVWVLATRPWSLRLSIAPIIVGSAVAWHEGGFHLLAATCALLTAMLLQIAANLANDVFDFHKGADTPQRLGHPRMTSVGWLGSRAVFIATIATLVLAMGTGLYLVYRGGMPILLLGILSMLCAVIYTGGPYPLAYNGLGDIFSFIFFGLVIVAGSAYVQTLDFTAMSVVASIPNGCMSVAVLVVNNLRDIHSDRAVGKRTIATFIGAENSRREYVGLLAVTFITPFVMWAVGWLDWTALILLLSAPLFLKLVPAIRATGPALNPLLGGTGKTSFVFSLLFAIALILST